MRSVFAAFALASLALAQTKPPADAPTGPPPGVISGTVTDAGTGAPIAEATVNVSGGAPNSPIQTTTDAQGHYTLRNVPAGQRRVSAQARSDTGRGFGAMASRPAVLHGGQELTGFDLHIRTQGQITGKIYDANKEPVPNLLVALIAREMSLGTVRYVFASAATTDDQGNYTLQRVEPGRAYLVLAQKRAQTLKPISDAPLDPRFRRPVPVPTFYPNSNAVEGAQPLTLRVGERREGIDIRMARAPNFCVDALLEGPNGPAAMAFQFIEAQPTSGSSGNGAMYLGTPRGKAGSDGKVRICDLHPGDYQLTVSQAPANPDGAPAFYASATVTVTDRDEHNVRLMALPPVPVPGEVSWFGDAPDKPAEGQIALSLQPMTRAPYGGEFPGLSARVAVPGEFSFPGLLPDHYSLDVRNLPRGAYLKDVTYNGLSIRYEPLRAGSVAGNATLRVILARDGGTISAKVTDDNNPVGNATLIVMPDSAGSEPVLAAAMVTGQTDQNGAWSSGTLPPGKYHVLALAAPVDKSPETIANLWRSRTTTQEVELAPNGSAQLTLTPSK